MKAPDGDARGPGIGRWLALAAAVVAADQATKGLVASRLVLGDSIEILPVLNLVRAHNAGAAFSFLAGESGWQRWFFVGIAVAASVFIVHLLRRHGRDQPLFAFSLAAILGGAIGNVIDRLNHGHVIDFVDLHLGGRHFPSFNVADGAITVGAVCLMLDELLRWRRSRRSSTPLS
jgi:signal peptidase II